MPDAPYITITDVRQLVIGDGTDAGDAPDIATDWPALDAQVRFTPKARDMTRLADGNSFRIDDVIGYYKPDGEMVRYKIDDGSGGVGGYGPAGVPLTDLASSEWASPFNADEASWDVKFENFGKRTPNGGPIAPGYMGLTSLGRLLPAQVIDGKPVIGIKGDPGDPGDPGPPGAPGGSDESFATFATDPNAQTGSALRAEYAPLPVAYSAPGARAVAPRPVTPATGVAGVTGGTTIDTEARATIGSLIAKLRESGLIAFTPTDVPGLHGWWDAQALTGLTDAASVASWPATFGAAGALGQTTTTKQPTYDIDGINGRPALYFNAANVQSMLTANFTAVTGPVTVFVVARHNGATVPTTRVVFDGVGASARRRQILLSTSPKWSVTNNAATVSSSFNNLPAEADVVSAVIADDQHTIRFGAIETVGTSAAATDNPLAWRVGANNADTSPWDGWIGEVLVYAARLTSAQIASVERYLAAKWTVELAQTGVRWVDYATGNDSNHGRRRNAPKATMGSAIGSVAATDPMVEINIRNTAATAARTGATNWQTWDDPRPLTVQSWTPSERFHVYGSTSITSGWTSEGGGVWSRAHTSDPIHVPVATMGHPDKPDMPDQLLKQETGDVTTPAAGTYTYSGGTLRIKLRDSSDPNSQRIELPVRNSAFLAQGAGVVRVRRGVFRYWRNPALFAATPSGVVAPVGARGFLTVEDCDVEYAGNGVATLLYASEVKCYNTRARFVANDGFNHHGELGHQSVMELWNCEGAYNDDEGASPHDDTILRVFGGKYHHNRRGGGITGVDRSRMEIDGAVCHNNRRGAPVDVAQGGVAFNAATMSGYVRNVTAVSNNGSGVYVAPGAAVQVDDIVSGVASRNAVADVVPTAPA